ncbi:cytochrome o ubiquinol oxidase subunit IV [Gallaecimonas kandeliae]|uniref:cytochrome o ubiquinol oxidase subunit IV n=1 Tax=Gallaecimonas kandeliae TaxID=3029055 RepID=UPI00264798BB|nr:cytochrome o ubiquinol oxidase subunit IV [Gallaecimonas kandeliae]WKE63912.1 cytochrome o ubiquinol oxidase subunit IV [Gallaecimonas kandeliae]
MSGHSHTAAGASHGDFKTYLNGFILSIILTVIPFGMVMFPGVVSPTVAIVTMVVLGLAQVLVQLVYFLHMNTSSEQQWNVIAFVFTILIALILIAGSVWIMWYLYGLTMPGM